MEHSTVMQLVQMRGETQYHLLCNLCRWGVEHERMFCYSTCADVVKLVQMRGGTQYVPLLVVAGSSGDGTHQ